MASDLETVIDPDRQWRELQAMAGEAGSTKACLKLAEEAEREGMWGEAVGRYRLSA